MAKSGMKWMSNIVRARELQVSIAMNAVHAAARVVQKQAQLNTRPPFAIHGRWNRGNLRRSIRVRVVRSGMRVWAEVGTMMAHGRYWELGHNNVLTGKYEPPREWLAPAFKTTHAEQQRAALKAAKATVLSKRALFRFRV